MIDKRNCPVCDSNDAKIIMRFTTALLCSVNYTYNKEELIQAVNGKEAAINYSKCNECGMVYCENKWDDDTLSSIYNKTIDHKKSLEKVLLIRKRIGLMRRWSGLLRLLKLEGNNKLNNLKVLDYGCGWGDFLDIAKGYGVDAFGYDVDRIKADSAEKRGHKIARNIDGLMRLGPADVVVLNSVLEHLQDVNHIFAIVREILKPNGFLMFSVMDYRKGYLRKNIINLNNNLPALTKNLNPLEHVNVYDYGSVKSTLEKYDFDFISTGLSLALTDWPFFRNKTSILRFATCLERGFSKIFIGQELGITVYAKKKVGR